jgi:WD40 repeat protein/energy-coupling factor transporter ATP-binding protein EcfA2
VYRNRSRPNPPLDAPEKLEEFLHQWKSLKEFFESWGKDSEGQFIGAFNNYKNLEEFERLFREHFRDFLSTQLSTERQRQLISRQSQARRWKENPFRGLRIFDFEHAPIFHGRTRAVGTVLEALEAQARAKRPFVLVVGPSGSGKSSLVRAGVLPLLAQPETIEGIGLWRRAVTRPGAGGGGGDCFDALAAALLEPCALPGLADPESQQPIPDLAAELREQADSVALRARNALDHAAREWKLDCSHGLEEKERQLRASGRLEDAELARQQKEGLELPKARLALVVDQLEELSTTGFSTDIRQRYVSAIASLVRSGRVFILATLRSDFYPWYQQFPDLIELTRPSGKVDLRPPTAYEIGNMIRLPAEAAGLHFDQDPESGQRLDQALRDAACVTPESLPLLEHILSLLYEEQNARGDGMLRWSDYRELGELKGALAKHAEAVFRTLQPHEQKTFPVVMRYLVTLSQGEEEVPNRRTVPYRDFVAQMPDHNQGVGEKGFVDRFIRERLLVADTDPRGEVTVTVAHEALLREWQRVKEWLAENREFLRMRDRLDASMRLWLSRGRQKDDLLGPGLPLAEGEKLVKDFEPSLSQEQTGYIHASIAERKRTKQVQERFRYAVMGAISVLAIFAGFQWLRADRQRRAAASAFQAKTQVAAKLQEQLQQASRASFSQAERQFHLGEWPEGIALLARAIKFDPQNRAASERFFQELIVHLEKMPPIPVSSFTYPGIAVDAVFSPDGARILTANWDKAAKLRDAVSGKLLSTFPHQGAVNSVVFSPDGTRILTASVDRTAKLWDVASAKVITSFAHQDVVFAAVFSPDGNRVLTASSDNTAKLWDAASGRLIASFEHQGTVYHGVFSPDGTRILTASKDRTAQLWDAASGQRIASFKHLDAVYHAVFSPDGVLILTASADKTAKLWDVASHKLVNSFAHQGPVREAVFSPDGARILTASWDNTAKLWDVATGKVIASFAHPASVESAEFSPNGAQILTSGWDKTVYVWEVPWSEPVAALAHQDGLLRATFSQDGVRILTASADKTARLWDATSGKLIRLFDHQNEVTDAVLSPDGARVLTASADKTARLWETSSGKLIATLAHRDAVNTAAFSPDGARILTASRDGTAGLWEAASGRLIASLVHADGVNDAVFSRDGRRILTASSDRSARLWDTASGKLIRSFDHEDAVYNAVFSPDDARILTASADHRARLWDAVSGKLLASFEHQDEVLDAAFSPDGTRVITASLDKTARLWDTATGKLFATFVHQDTVYHGLFSPDGAGVLTASADNTAKLWDAASGKLIASFDHQDSVRGAAFSPDGARVVTASWDKTARLWDVATPVALARQLKESNSEARSSSGALPVSAPLAVESLSAVAGGLEFSDDGSLVPVDRASRSELARRLKASAESPRPDARLLRWLFSKGSERTIFPASDTKAAEWVDNALLTNENATEQWLRNALVFLPDHPLLHIALAGFETDARRADFLRAFGLARLQKDSIFCTRAGEILLAQHRPELALAAVDKALAADPKDLPARRLRLKVLQAMP